MKSYATFEYESKLWQQGKEYIAGVDEVGRGCLAGPVVAAAVVFPKNYNLQFDVADSKKLSASKREKLAPLIKCSCLSWAIGVVEPQEIDTAGILPSTFKAMRIALKELIIVPDFVLVDGNLPIVKVPNHKQKSVVDGDQLIASIAAASIIAKVYRDQLMQQIHQKVPFYCFDNNVGYGTKDHYEAIKKHGVSHLHRRTFVDGDLLK